jgi:hypothetical protein
MPPLTYSLLPPLMRKTTRLALLAITPLAACGVIKHTYVAEGVSVLSYRSQRLSPALDARAGITLDALPTWAFGVNGTWVRHPDNASYFEPKCFTYVDHEKKQTGCYPKIGASSAAIDVQKRWGPTRTMHPFASAGLGQVQTGNVYSNSAKSLSGTVDSMRTSTFVTLGGGGELNLTGWLHVTLTAGYRGVFRQETPNGPVARSGFTLTSLLLVGKPYRDP